MKLDMTNPHHVNLRRLLAELFSKHALSLQVGDFERATMFKHMVSGMARLCTEVLKDYYASSACDHMFNHMNSVEFAESVRRAA
ncbi:MAG: hypothetical protein ACPGUD_13090 [Parashewanella sp.]